MLKKEIDLDTITKVIDVIMCICIVLLSVKKGGFYISDAILFNIFTGVLGIICIVFNIIARRNTDGKKKKFNVLDVFSYLDVLVISLAIAYALPIIFNRFSDITDSFYEMIRYFDLAIIYFVIRLSKNKGFYLNSIISVGVVQAILGIDGLGLRILWPFLKKFESGYLTIDLTRLSGTIQYANTVAIIMAVSSLLVLDKIIKNLELIKSLSTAKKEKNIKNSDAILNRINVNQSVLYMLLFILFSTIILTGSRAVLIIFLIALIICCFKNKENLSYLLYTILSQIIIVSLYTGYMQNYVGIDSISIYFIFVLSILISFVIGFIINKVCNHNNKVRKEIKSSPKVIVISVAVVLIAIAYGIVGANISKSLIVDSGAKVKNANREIYGSIPNEKNNISIKVKELEEDSRYNIKIFEENNKFESKYLTEFNYYDSTTGEFNYTYTADSDVKRLNVYIECQKGKVSVESLKLNDKNITLEYALIPTEYVLRIKNVLNGSTSVNDRIEYSKDALKLISASPIVGLGGEGFRNMYKEVQTVNYNSSEVHDSFLQIAVETGVIGALIIIGILVLSIKNSKYSAVKLAYLLFVVHSLIDLNFSFMISIIIFAILLANIEEKQLY